MSFVYVQTTISNLRRLLKWGVTGIRSLLHFSRQLARRLKRPLNIIKRQVAGRPEGEASTGRRRGDVQKNAMETALFSAAREFELQIKVAWALIRERRKEQAERKR